LKAWAFPSSRQQLVGMALPGRFELHRLLNLAGEFIDLGGDVSTQQLESGNCGQRD
jgi:hypothetical protein